MLPKVLGRSVALVPRRWAVIGRLEPELLPLAMAALQVKRPLKPGGQCGDNSPMTGHELPGFFNGSARHVFSPFGLVLLSAEGRT